MSQTNEVIIGIDVSKDKLDIHIGSKGNHITIENKKKNINLFFKQNMLNFCIKMIVLEATGGYERKCVQVINELGLLVHIAHPNQVYHFAKSKKLLAKTDKIDSKILALFGEEEAVTPTSMRSEEEEELARLVRRKQQLTDLMTQEKVRLSGPLATGEMGRSIKRIVKQLEREIALIDSKLKAGIKKSDAILKKVNILKSFKGIGDTTANTLALCVPELGKVTRADIASLIGVAPINKDSGKKKGHRGIQGGRFNVRKALYMASLSAIQYNVDMKAFYARLIGNGKKAKVAMVAVMRKMIVTLNALIRDNENWEPALNSN